MPKSTTHIDTRDALLFESFTAESLSAATVGLTVRADDALVLVLDMTRNQAHALTAQLMRQLHHTIPVQSTST